MNKIILITIFLISNTLLHGQNNRLIIENVTVIPIHIHQQWEGQDVIIENGIITNIRPHETNDTGAYDLGRIKGEGKYLIPSFSDAHVHLPKKETLESFFLMNLVNGITSLRSMRGELWHTEIDTNKEFVPRLTLSAPPISRKDSINQFVSDSLFTLYKDKGFHFVKMLSIKNKESFDNLVHSAKKIKIPVAGHCPSNIGIVNVSESGVYQSIEHLGGFFQLPNTKTVNSIISQTIENNIYHCATLDWYYTGQVLVDKLRERKGVEYLPKKMIEGWESKINSYYSKSSEEKQENDREASRNKFEKRLNYLNQIYRQGGLLLLSPDASGLYSVSGFGIHTEMQHYSNAGISNFDILKSTCYNLAEMIGEESDWGSIKTGSSSDLVLLNDNPLENIQNTEKIEGVVLKGKYYSQEKLLKKLKNIYK